MNFKFKKSRGITLIALVITIIVLLILAGVTISTLTGDNGILTQAQNAKTVSEEATIKEEIELALAYSMMNDKNDSNIDTGMLRSELESNGITVNTSGDLPWTVTKDGYKFGITADGIVTSKKVESVESLQKKYEFSYYSSLSKAVADVNNNTIGTNADVDEEDAVAGIYTTDEGEISVVLLKDTTESETIKPNKDVTINLGGKLLTINNKIGISGVTGNSDTITIDGRIEGSGIEVNGKDNGVRAIQTGTNTFVINGGKYTANMLTETTATSIQVVAAFVTTGGELIIEDCKLEINEAENVPATVVGVNSNGNSTIRNCEVQVNSENETEGTRVYGVAVGNTTSEVDIKDSSIVANSNYNSAPEGSSDYYGVLSIGIVNYGSLNLTNCNVIGTHSGVENVGNLYVDGGIYKGYGHGGFYFVGTGETYVSNATITECDMPDGYTATAGDNNVGLYIGGSETRNNIKVYMDNCDIYGSVRAIVLRGSSGEKNNTLYISNSRINEGSTIRIDNDTHKLYIGQGCNFDLNDTTYPSMVVSTNEVYKRK